MTIGSTLRLLRTAANLTQSSLAKELDVTANYLSLVENGRKEPSLTFLKKVSKALDAPLGYFLWLALQEKGSPEELNLKQRMDELLFFNADGFIGFTVKLKTKPEDDLQDIKIDVIKFLSDSKFSVLSSNMEMGDTVIFDVIVNTPPVNKIEYVSDLQTELQDKIKTYYPYHEISVENT